MKKTFDRVTKNFIKFYSENKIEFLFLLAIILVSAFVRLYKIDQYMTFLGDEGRDVVIVRRFLTEGDIFLIGPGTSIGNMYLGPMYYYMMAPALLLFNFSPVGPAIQIAILGVVTTWFVWFVIREWFPNKDNKTIHFSALGAALLYSLAPTVIIYSRSSWNPNIMPFFALLAVYSVWKVIDFKDNRWLWVLGFSFAAVMQSHYLGLLLAPLLGLMWLFAFWLHWSKDRIKYLLNSFAGFGIFIALMSPLAIFDARHGFRNFDAIKLFFTERQTTVSARPWTAFPKIPELYEQITTRVLGGRNEEIGAWAALGLILAVLFILKSYKKVLDYRKATALFILVAWILIGLIGFGIYKQHIYDHYYGFLFPAYFILFGAISHLIVKKSRFIGSWLMLILFAILLSYNLADNPLRYHPNRQLQRSVEVADKIRLEAGDQKFNLAVIAERNYEAAYEYFLLKNNDPVTDIDPQNTAETITDQLFVVCEMPELECQPTNNAKAEVANFGWSQIEEQWNIAGVTLYKLVHVEITEE